MAQRGIQALRVISYLYQRLHMTGQAVISAFAMLNFTGKVHSVAVATAPGTETSPRGHCTITKLSHGFGPDSQI